MQSKILKSVYCLLSNEWYGIKGGSNGWQAASSMNDSNDGMNDSNEWYE